MNKNIIKLSETVTGSRLYQTHTETSDQDKIVVFVYTTEARLRGETAPSFRRGDTVYYELDRFLELLLKGEITCHEVLWATGEYIKDMHPAFDILRSHKRDFIDKRVVTSWLHTSQVVLNHALRLGKLDEGEKTIEDFLKVLTIHAIYGLHTSTFKNCVERGNFDPHNIVKAEINLASHGITKVEGQTNYYNIWRDYIQAHKEGAVSGIIKDDQLVIDDNLDQVALATYNRFTFKGVLHYDRRGHLNYKSRRERMKGNKIIRGYAPKSMYHAFRILSSLLHYISYKRVVTEAVNLELLKDIRKGQCDIPYLENRFKREVEVAENLLLSDELGIPPEVDYETLTNIIIRVKSNILEKNKILLTV